MPGPRSIRVRGVHRRNNLFQEDRATYIGDMLAAMGVHPR